MTAAKKAASKPRSRSERSGTNEQGEALPQVDTVDELIDEAKQKADKKKGS